MADADQSRKRKADAASEANKRPRLSFDGEVITLHVECSLDPKDFVLHRDVIAQRTRKFDYVAGETEYTLDTRSAPVAEYLRWLYDGSVEILELADAIADRDLLFDFPQYDSFELTISEEDTVLRVLALVELWYAGYVIKDMGFCNNVMDTICHQIVGAKQVVVVFWGAFISAIPWSYRQRQSYASFEAPARWLVDCMAKSGDASELVRVVGNDQMIPVSKAIMERMIQAQKLVTIMQPALGQIHPEQYHLDPVTGERRTQGMY